jgi:G3E family GTPase
MDSKLIPVVVVTGYLGAGKTTLLNNILRTKSGTRFAVVVNEFGEIGIDNDLIVDAEEEIFEMNNGCICCSVRGDLIRILGALHRRRNKIDCVVIETTGLADPAPVAQTFFVDEDIRRAFKLQSIITVVDALNFPARLQDSDEAEEQVAFADVVVLNKCDLVSREELQRSESLIKKVNPTTAILTATRGEIPVDKLFSLSSFNIERILQIEPEFLNDVSHEHSDDISSICLTTDRDIDRKLFDRWMTELLQNHGANILRTKGILSFRDADEQYAFQAVHMTAEGDFIRKWGDASPRISRLVFIGRNLGGAGLDAGFKSTFEN